MDAAQILVIILSATLAFFLILSIVLVVYLIKIASQIKRVTDTAERAAGKFESVAGILQKAAAPAVVTKIVGELIQKFADSREYDGSKNKKDKD
ncbi:MAG: hypothetical protein PVI21_05620 [Candidatus Woesebacteria bacterium]|jgi:hypothetical protein